jgi:hypothetical protein
MPQLPVRPYMRLLWFGVLPRMARRTTLSWRSVTSERLPDLAEISGDRSGQLHALQLGW